MQVWWRLIISKNLDNSNSKPELLNFELSRVDCIFNFVRLSFWKLNMYSTSQQTIFFLTNALKKRLFIILLGRTKVLRVKISSTFSKISAEKSFFLHNFQTFHTISKKRKKNSKIDVFSTHDLATFYLGGE